MAIVTGNVLLHGASGQIGKQIVVRQTDQGVIVGALADKSL